MLTATETLGKEEQFPVQKLLFLVWILKLPYGFAVRKFPFLAS
jgi:hypothetical protein